ncbi:hypothetical protein AB0O90_17035 [Microbacterium testaceum]|uniref:hypothetical protein n=1 Tax=Microbacterium testaceum TaxID=2033 RepID=UPI0034315E6D
MTVTRRRASSSTPALERANGYAVRVGEGWFWFPAIEPAYVFARTARMPPAGGGSIYIVEAAHEVRFDEKLGRDVFSLLILDGGDVSVDPALDADMVRRFVDGLDSSSAHWPVRS